MNFLEASLYFTTRFEKNLTRLSLELPRSELPVIAVVGQSGAGKSSLVWSLSGGAVTPKPNIGLETDATDWSKQMDVDLISRSNDMMFVDVPGYGTKSHPTNILLSHFPLSEFSLLMFVLSGKVRGDDKDVFKRMIDCGRPLAIIRNYAESLDDAERLEVRRDFQLHLGLPDAHNVWFTSCRTQSGVSALRSWICQTIKLYPEVGKPREVTVRFGRQRDQPN
jgi:GTP-binding protein EngB required for normal cell division